MEFLTVTKHADKDSVDRGESFFPWIEKVDRPLEEVETALHNT